MKHYNKGVYPTMITPFTKNGEIDYDGVDKIVDFYIERGCDGIFAVCQSSEMIFMTLEERVKLAKRVVNRVDGRINVVASGHCADSIDEQIKEVNAMAETGADAIILVSNRLDLHNDGDKVWINNAKRLLKGIDKNIDLGIYECPMPYKRLLTPEIIDWCLDTGRFKFIKDTCCDPDLLVKRLDQLNGSDLYLFNANAQTTLHSLQHGAAGYSGIMANFHPELYVWLCNHFKDEPKKAETLQAFLSMYAFTECMHYPITAKYHMNLEDIDIDLYTRWKNQKECTEYEKLVIRQGYDFEKQIMELIDNI